MSEPTDESELREGQCQSHILFRDFSLELYCNLDEGHQQPHISYCQGYGLIAGRDWDDVVGELDEPTPEMEAMLQTDLEIRWRWPISLDKEDSGT